MLLSNIVIDMAPISVVCMLSAI